MVETDIHCPTDSTLLSDVMRVLTRTMCKIAAIAGAVGQKLRDLSRSISHRLIAIGRASRSRSEPKEKLKLLYEKLLAATGRAIAQANRFAQEMATGIKHASSAADQVRLAGWQQYLETIIPRAKEVMRQTCEHIGQRQHADDGQDCEPVRAAEQNHPQGQSRQIHRVRQDEFPRFVTHPRNPNCTLTHALRATHQFPKSQFCAAK